MSEPRSEPMTLLEIAAGFPFGIDQRVAPLRASRTATVRAALEREILSGLQRPPCLVSFSGGRDSSAVLAIATRVARREGLPEPVPMSLVFPNSTTAGEDDHQQRVIEHLGLRDWVRPSYVDDEMDIVGTLARDFLLKFGVRWPFNAYFHIPIMTAAAGGAVLTGVGGDQLFAGWQWIRENLVITMRERPMPLDPIRIAVAVGPSGLRRAFLKLRYRTDNAPRQWLRAAAREQVRKQVLALAAADTLSYRRSLGSALWRRRSRILGLETLADLATSFNVRCISPFYAPSVVAALMAEQGFRGFESRSAAMHHVVGDLLPVRILERETKASFGDVFFSRPAQEFAATWDGGGLEESIVDVGELAQLWRGSDEIPDARTFALMQMAWSRRATGTSSDQPS